MGARYSDRFFGPTGVGREPRTTPGDAVDLVEGVDVTASAPDPAQSFEEPRPWHGHRGARVALAGAVVAGAGSGAYAWDGWRDHQAQIVARSVADLSSSASVNSFNEDGTQFEVGVNLHNDGDYVLAVLNIGATDARLVPVGAQWQRVELDPGEEMHRAVDFAIDCSRETAKQVNGAGTLLTADLTSVDGAAHQETVDVDYYYGGNLSGLLDEQCAVSAGYADFSGLYPEVVQVQLVDDSVAGTIVLHSPRAGNDPALPQTYNVVSSSSGFSAVLDHSEEAATGESATVRVLWTVRDCSLALAATDADMTIELTGQMPSEPTSSTLTSFPSTALTVALARLSERVCD